VVNTCAFVHDARQESIEVILDLAGRRADGARLVVTGCLAERYGSELTDAMQEIDGVAGFGVDLLGALGTHGAPVSLLPGDLRGATPVTLGATRRARIEGGPGVDTTAVPTFDLLNLARPAVSSPWAYVKIAEGCDRACGYCAIPSFRGPQRSRPVAEVVAEVEGLDVREVVLVAQDLAAFGRDQGRGERSLASLVHTLGQRVDRVRLLYLYPADLTDELVDAVLGTRVPYFDLSLQHVSSTLLRRMRRWGDGTRFLERIERIREREPGAAFRSNMIVGYPGETEADHDALLAFLDEAQLDWCGIFAFSPEPGTYAVDLDGQVDPSLVAERLAEVREVQDAITAAKRDALLGTTVEVLVDRPGEARSYREAPEIDGIVTVPDTAPIGEFFDVRVVDAMGPDLVGEPVDDGRAGDAAG
jgi:ribosomal protein S12 methylthiotransferase